MTTEKNADGELDQLMDTLSNLTVMNLHRLCKKMEEEWDVKAAAPMVAAAPAAAPSAEGGAAEDVEKSAYDIEIQPLKDQLKKLGAIKIVKEVTGMSLGDAKAAVEGAPKVLKTGVPTAEAKELKQKIEEAGAEVKLK
jgi:large subunit ribosomal protein L7/L12